MESGGLCAYSDTGNTGGAVRDNELIRLFLPVINADLIEREFLDVTVKQSNQPPIQGANSGSTVYFYKLFDKRFGWVRKNSEWDADSEAMVHTEMQMYETTFQISAMVRQNPLNTSKYTASDLINEVASIMQSDSTIRTFANSDVGVLRITDIQNPYFKDDYENFEAFASFDFTLTHRQTRVTVEPVVQSVELKLYRV